MKKSIQLPLLTICFSILLLAVNAQGWEKVYSPGLMMGITSVYQTPDHGFITTGWNLNEGVNRVVRTDSVGNIIWYHDFEGRLGGTLSNITQDGGIVMIGPGSTWLLRVNSMGQEVWFKTIYTDTAISETHNGDIDVDTTNNGGFICSFNSFDTATRLNEMLVTRVDSNGNVVWQKTYYDSINYTYKYIYRIRNSGDGGFLANVIIDSLGDAILFKIDSAGNKLWADSALPQNEALYATVAHDGNILLVGNTIISKINQNGQQLWSTQYSLPQDAGYAFANMVEKANNTYAILMATNIPGGGDIYKFVEVNEAGNVLKQNRISTAQLPLQTQIYILTSKVFIPTADGGFLAGAWLVNDPEGYSALLIKMDSNGIVYPNQISGTAYADTNNSCVQDSGEFGLLSMIISFTGRDTFQVATDANGYYWAQLDTGNYAINAVPLSPYWTGEPCNAGNLNFSTPNTDTVLNFAMQEVVNCPYITVDGGIFHIRTCIGGYYYAQYCNEGTAPLNGGLVEVDVDTLLVVDSFSVPLLYNTGNKYYFAADTLPLFQCREFTVYFHTPCDQSLDDRTACIRTAVSPNTLCYVPAGWDQSNLSMSVECNTQQDSVAFTLTNTGTQTMSVPEKLLVIEDNVILRSLPVQLNAGEQLILKELANGATYRATIPQTIYNPTSDFTTAAVEGCVANAQTPISKGFFLDYPFNGVNAFEHTTCNAINHSFDPNNKSVTPIGVGDNNLIDTTTALEYMIEFQNTGTDTAYQVRVVDTLSSYLDPSTIKLGISNYKCSFSIQGNGILIFNFVNINLPDSGHNQLLSSGFIQFTIRQRTNNTPGTVINNNASIFFDYNSPVITNTVFHTIGSLSVTGIENLVPEKQVLITAFPNPFSDKTTIQVTGGDFHSLQMNVYDLTGRKVKAQGMENSNQFIVDGTGLALGNYLFEIKSGETIIGRGKIVVQ